MPCLPGAPWLHPPVAALGVPDTVRVPGVRPTVRVEMPEVVLDVVPARWLGAGVLPATLVLIMGVAVVSARVVKSLAKVAVGAGVVGGGTAGGEALLVPGDVLDLSGVKAPISGLEGGRVAAVVESVVESVVGSSAEASIGVGEVEIVGDMVAVTSVVVPAKRWENEVRKGWQ